MLKIKPGNYKRRKWKLEMEIENGIGKWKWSSSIHARTRSINTTCIEYLEVASSSGTSSVSMYIEKLGGPEDETN